MRVFSILVLLPVACSSPASKSEVTTLSVADVRANLSKHMGKVVRVKGKLESKGNGVKAFLIYLRGETESIECRFPPEMQNDASIEGKKKGDEITVEGTVNAHEPLTPDERGGIVLMEYKIVN